jgi:hypothetical protein
MVRIRTLGMAAARVAAVVFALVTLVVFVVQAQRKGDRRSDAAPNVVAHPAPPPDAAATDADASASAPPDPTRLIAPMDDGAATFLPTSKSLQWQPSSLVPSATSADETDPSFGTDPQSPVFLPSSKVRMMSDGVRDILRPGSTLPPAVKTVPKP